MVNDDEPEYADHFNDTYFGGRDMYSKLKEPEELDRPTTMMTLLPLVGGVLGIIVLSLAFLKGFAWVANDIYLPLSSVAGPLVVILAIVGLILIAWKRNGTALVLASYVWLFPFWVWCLLAVYATLGMIGVGVGVIFVGVGVLPIAFVGMLISGWWSLLLVFAGNLIGIFALWFIGNYFNGK